jgi:hypothetical protein
MEVTLSASKVRPSIEIEKEIRRFKRALKEHSPLVFKASCTPRPVAGFSARFRPPMKRFASGGKAMFTARLLCYPLVCCARTGLQHISAAWSDK